MGMSATGYILITLVFTNIPQLAPYESYRYPVGYLFGLTSNVSIPIVLKWFQGQISEKLKTLEQKESCNEENKIEPVKQIEIDTKDLVASSRIWIYLIIGLLVYMMFFIIPTIEEKVTWMEKDLNSVLVQSERFKRSTRVFAKDNQCFMSPKSRFSFA